MILVTGGCGYIGSHTVVELITAGAEVLILDNLSQSDIRVLDRIERITGQRPRFVQGDIRDQAALRALFSRYAISEVIHFAGLKVLGESVSQPLSYYDNNVQGSLVLFRTMAEFGVKRLVFSSTAAVYGVPHAVPVCEDFPVKPTNPYSRSKLMIEEILRDLAAADPEWRIALLRYFNPVGAHVSGLIGENSNGMPNNLMPFVAQVASGKRAELSVFGSDYPTHDGTGVRDFIHVVDLAQGHLAALKALAEKPGVLTVNLGTGQGYSVLDLVKAFEQASGQAVPYRLVGRRAEDVASCYADPKRALAQLAWKAERGIKAMCEDTWRWQSMNPNGFAS